MRGHPACAVWLGRDARGWGRGIGGGGGGG